MLIPTVDQSSQSEWRVRRVMPQRESTPIVPPMATKRVVTGGSLEGRKASVTLGGVRIEEEVTIGRPLTQVWDFVADMRNDESWCDKVVAVEQVEGNGPGNGARYRVMHQPIRRRDPKPLLVEVLEHAPPGLMRIREEDDDAVFDVTYELEETAGATRLTQRDSIDWKIPRYQRPIGNLMVRRDVRRQLRELKTLLEGRE